MKFKQDCFLRSPEWQDLLSQHSTWPFQTSQQQSLSLRTRLIGILVDLPSLIISAINESSTFLAGWEERVDILILKSYTISANVKKWLVLEAEPLFLWHRSSHQVTHENIYYPDIISGILDCVAHKALLTIDKFLRFLFNLRIKSSKFFGPDGHQQETDQFLDDDETIERWRQRTSAAFRFVQGESEIAAKPLDFGLRQM